MSDAVPAVRLDRPRVQEEDDREEPENEGPDGSGKTQVSLEPGMTLYSLAQAYKVSLSSLMRANGINDPSSIPAGTMISIPDRSGAEPQPRSRKAARAPVAHARARDETDSAPATLGIAWPLIGQITAGFGQRGRQRHHAGVDIDGVTGEEVRAVAAGIVVASGSEGKYGRTVVIDHGSGLTTLYAHASRLLVHEGDRVGQGEAIAEVGASGNAHGSHLHFEVRRDGHPVDPTPYLRSGSVPLPGGHPSADSDGTSSGSR
jgi:murein DD-endopeptidase MepM/ murein hydrolase activator NlpD